jgi:sporulation protein YlmC with PRC-barrel domain
MARYASFGTMLAATALIAWPVMAQTAGSPATSPPPTSPPPGMTPSHSATPGMTTSASPPAMPANTASTTTATPTYFTADHQVRVSKVVGATVYNDQNQSIGSVDDVLMNDSNHTAGSAVLSVGGFLGMGSKLVSVPFDQLKIGSDKIVMPGASKASLEGMPEYRYKSA